jgi:hypothetical protein
MIPLHQLHGSGSFSVLASLKMKTADCAQPAGTSEKTAGRAALGAPLRAERFTNSRDLPWRHGRDIVPFIRTLYRRFSILLTELCITKYGCLSIESPPPEQLVHNMKFQPNFSEPNRHIHHSVSEQAAAAPIRPAGHGLRAAARTAHFFGIRRKRGRAKRRTVASSASRPRHAPPTDDLG